MISIDGLDLGTYSFTLVLFDTSGNNKNYAVMVSVVDTTDPALSSPGDIQFKVEDASHNLACHSFYHFKVNKRLLTPGNVIMSIRK